MAHRGNTGKYDKSIFARTALKTKRINVKPKISRGGTCL